ncbi:hypothetical protein [Dokdonia sp.]|uniref:hypothetical protein n=1 Tax=Dokdonia sp. TaxID=2024995 RepID=UPI0032667A24
MGIFNTLFGKKKLKITDPDYGDIESIHIKGTHVDWLVKQSFIGTHIDVFLRGDKNGISDIQKRTLQTILTQEAQISFESEKALKEQFENANMEFINIDTHFDVRSLFIQEQGFELTFQEKKSPYYFFNVFFENNKAVGVSVDG